GDTFDPAPFQTGLGHILSGTGTSQLAILREGSDEIAQHFEIIMIAPLGGRSPAAGLSLSVQPFPEVLKGQTFEWDVTGDEYGLAAAAGPVAGARFLVYQLSGDAYAEPLVDAGHIDLLDDGHGPANVARLVAEIAGESQGNFAAYSTGTLQAGTVGIDGFFGTGSARVEFDVDAVNTVTAAGTASSYTATFAVPGSDLTAAVAIDVDRGAVVTHTARTHVAVPGSSLELDGEYDGTAFIGVVRVGGALRANVVKTGAAAPVITAAGDAALTEPQRALLVRVVDLIDAPTAYLDELLPPFAFVLGLSP